MKHIKSLFSLAFTILFFCSFSEIDPDSSIPQGQINEENQLSITDTTNKPTEDYNDFIYTPQRSVFNVPVEISVDALQKSLNENLKGLVYEDNVIEDDSLKIKIWKTGDFTIAFSNDTLTTEIPIKLWAMKRFGIAGFTYTDREIEAAISIKLQSRLQISKSWGIISNTKLVNYKWDRKPTTKLAGIDIPLTYIIDHALDSNKRKLELLIDESIKSKISTREYAVQLWKQIQDPIPVEADSYKAWINLRPTNILMKPLKGEGNLVKTGFGVQCDVEVTVGDQPLKRSYTSTLPECKLNNSMQPGWELNLLANVPYSVIDSLAMDNLRGQALGEGRHTIFVDKVHTYGSGNFLAIELLVHGFVNGNIYLTGIPYYDKDKVSIRLRDVAYSFKTKNLLHKTINIVVKPILKNMLEKKFEMPMQDNFYLIEQMGTSELLNNKWAENVFTSGNITKVDGGDIYITKTGIQAALSIEGQLIVNFK